MLHLGAELFLGSASPPSASGRGIRSFLSWASPQSWEGCAHRWCMVRSPGLRVSSAHGTSVLHPLCWQSLKWVLDNKVGGALSRICQFYFLCNWHEIQMIDSRALRGKMAHALIPFTSQAGVETVTCSNKEPTSLAFIFTEFCLIRSFPKKICFFKKCLHLILAKRPRSRVFLI